MKFIAKGLKFDSPRKINKDKACYYKVRVVDSENYYTDWDCTERFYNAVNSGKDIPEIEVSYFEGLSKNKTFYKSLRLDLLD